MPVRTDAAAATRPTRPAMLAFLAPSLALASQAQRRRRPLASSARCCADGAEPAFFTAIRGAAPAVLAERDLAIADMEWSGRCLRVYVSTRADVEGRPDAVGATVDECQFASQALGELLDADEALVPYPEYTLEVSSPGTRDVLTKDREFEAFKGFEVTVRTSEVYKKNSAFVGTLHGRDDKLVKLNIKGRILGIPRELVAEVRMETAKEEPM
jgi:ribosome maturation factor RimP